MTRTAGGRFTRSSGLACAPGNRRRANTIEAAAFRCVDAAREWPGRRLVQASGGLIFDVMLFVREHRHRIGRAVEISEQRNHIGGILDDGRLAYAENRHIVVGAAVLRRNISEFQQARRSKSIDDCRRLDKEPGIHFDVIPVLKGTQGVAQFGREVFDDRRIVDRKTGIVVYFAHTGDLQGPLLTACVSAGRSTLAGPFVAEANRHVSMVDDTIATRVRSLAEAFAVSGLARLTIRDAAFELELRRSAASLPPLPAAAAAGTAAPETNPKKSDIVTSDLVGVLRLSRPQVSEGQQLESDRELAFVEALGIRNPVRSRGAGKVAAIYVSDGQPVEYGQPLFAIER